MLPRLEGGWQDKLFCAGEYSSPGFYGYMEGACIAVRYWSSFRCRLSAGRLARRLNLGQSGLIRGRSGLGRQTVPCERACCLEVLTLFVVHP
jgi:hypothetical protein